MEESNYYETKGLEINLVEDRRIYSIDTQAVTLWVQNSSEEIKEDKAIDGVFYKKPTNLKTVHPDKTCILDHMLIFLNALRNRNALVSEFPKFLKDSVIFCPISGIRFSLDLDCISHNLFHLFQIVRSIIAAYEQTFIPKNNVLMKYSGNKNDCYIFDLNTNFKQFNYDHGSDRKRIQRLYQYFVLLLNDYNYIENVNAKLMRKIKDIKINASIDNTENDSKKFCKSCIELQGNLQKIEREYNVISKNYTSSQTEKERMVMRYATSEKHLIEAQRTVKQSEKKYQEIFKENVLFQKKMKKAHDDIIKLTSEMNNKCMEITQLRSQIEHQKDKDNAKEKKLKYFQNRLQFVTENHKETQTKLDESLINICKLTNEYELLRSQIRNINQNVQTIADNKVINNDQRLKEQQALSKLEYHFLRDSETSEMNNQPDFDSSTDKKSFVDEENHMLISQIKVLQKECSDYQSQMSLLNLALEREKKNVENLKDQLIKSEIVNEQQSQSTNHRISNMGIELNCLHNEKAEYQSDIEAYRQREIQMLDFTQKLTDKNVQLQCEFTNMQAKLRLLESNQNPLHTRINKLLRDIHNLDDNSSYEKAKNEKDTELLTKYIAEQLLYINQLSHQLEDLQGENAVLRKKYESSIREINRELHSHYAKCPSKNLPSSCLFTEIKNHDNMTSANKDFCAIPEETFNDEEKYKTSELLEKEKLFNQIIKLQKINAKRAERLDFLEEHSHALLEELQRKKNISDLGTNTDNRIPTNSTSRKKNNIHDIFMMNITQNTMQE